MTRKEKLGYDRLLGRVRTLDAELGQLRRENAALRAALRWVRDFSKDEETARYARNVCLTLGSQECKVCGHIPCLGPKCYDPPPVSEDSPTFTPLSLTELEARGFKRHNRFRPSECPDIAGHPALHAGQSCVCGWRP